MKSRQVACALFLVAVLAQNSFTVSGTPPCPPINYSVSYSSPVWTIKMILDSEWPLGTVWFYGSETGDQNASIFESMLNQTGRLPTLTERVTCMDRDSDLNLSDGDEILLWEENASHESQEYRSFTLFFGNPWTGFGMSIGIAAHDGLVTTCDNALDDPIIGILFFIAALAVVSIIAAIAIMVGRRLRQQR